MMEVGLLIYKGYRGDYQYSHEDKVYHGKLLYINDLVNFESENENDIKKSFEEAVDDYLEFCKADGKEPNTCHVIDEETKTIAVPLIEYDHLLMVNKIWHKSKKSLKSYKIS